jgi:general secretion pathway protein G
MNMNTRKVISNVRKQAAFTLIELVLVLSIIAILVAAVALNSSGFLGSAQDTTVAGDLQKINTALIAYQASAGRPPSTEQGLEALVSKPTKPPVPDKWYPYMDELPKDPWKQTYHYKTPATKSKKQYDIWSSGADGVDGTPDDIGNWKKEEGK